MDLQHWQAQFENWLKNHHQHQDAAHDVCHFRRVWATAQKLAADDDVDMLVILTACYFHDIVSLAKNHPQRQRSSILAAEETRRLLCEEFEQFPAEKIEAVCHAIAAHSFSAQIAPLTTEAKIVQDADRLEALGAIGLARVFAVSGALVRVPFWSRIGPGSKQSLMNTSDRELSRKPFLPPPEQSASSFFRDTSIP